MTDISQLDSTSINLSAIPTRIWQPKTFPLILRKPRNQGSNVTVYGAVSTLCMTPMKVDTHDQTIYHMVCDTVSEPMNDAAQTNRVNVLEFLRRVKGRLDGTTSCWVGAEAMELRARQR